MEKYDITKEIGRGSYGQVFLVTHKEEKNTYVLKKISLKDTPEKYKEASFQEVSFLFVF